MDRPTNSPRSWPQPLAESSSTLLSRALEQPSVQHDTKSISKNSQSAAMLGSVLSSRGVFGEDGTFSGNDGVMVWNRPCFRIQLEASCYTPGEVVLGCLKERDQQATEPLSDAELGELCAAAGYRNTASAAECKGRSSVATSCRGAALWEVSFGKDSLLRCSLVLRRHHTARCTDLGQTRLALKGEV